MTNLTTLLIAVLFFGFSLGATPPDSEDCLRRLEGDVYFQAVRACKQSGALTVADIQTILAGPSPSNPIESTTPLAENASARRLLTTLAANPDVQAQWPQTQARLREYLNELTGAQGLEQTAHKDTAQVLAPHEIGRLPTTGMSFQWSELDDGTPIVAYIHAKSLVISTVDGTELHCIQLPHASGWIPAWHEEDGMKWLYLAGQTSDNNAFTEIFRLNLRDKKLIPVPYASGVEEAPALMSSAGPGWLILQTFAMNATDSGQAVLNLDHGRAVPMRSNLHFAPECSPAVRENGELATRKRGRWRKVETLLTLKNRRTLRFTGSKYNKLVITDEDDATFKYEGHLKDDRSEFIDILPFETPDNELYVALVKRDIGTHARDLIVFKPFAGNEPYYESHSEDADNNTPQLHFFTGAANTVYLGYEVGSSLRIVDLKSKEEIFSSKLTKFIYGWYSSRNQTLLWTPEDDHIAVWGMLGGAPGQD